MKITSTLSILIALANVSLAQKSKSANYGDVSVALEASQSSLTIDYFHNWKLGKKQKLEIGFGGRFTSYFSSSQYYETAPARLTTGSTGPGVLFKETIEENIDSLLIKSPQVNAFNLAVNIGYRISSKVGIGFNIDAIGFSFGQNKNGTYINGLQSITVSGTPTGFNGLGIGDNDHGSLNSEFYGRYFFKDFWAVKIGFQYLFTEYTTITNAQQFPEPNDRFRNKSSMFSVGLTRQFK